MSREKSTSMPALTDTSMGNRTPVITGMDKRKCMETITGMTIPGIRDIITMRIPCTLRS